MPSRRHHDRRWTRSGSRVAIALAASTIAGAGCGDAGNGSETSFRGPVAVEVVDGDTLIVADASGEETVRLIGVNTPESGECFADEATAALTELVDGVPLVLVPDESDRDRYDRLLRYVETVDGTDVGAALVTGGFAIARRYEPDVARDDEYAELQDQARVAERGLWAPDACGPALVERGVIEVEINPDAPGDDNDNLNGEWIRITNISGESLELAGWMVADESASHRYEFGEIALGPGDGVTLFTGCGVDTNEEVFWCADGSAVWNNSGDSVIVRDPNGNLILFESYGESS